MCILYIYYMNIHDSFITFARFLLLFLRPCGIMLSHEGNDPNEPDSMTPLPRESNLIRRNTISMGNMKRNVSGSLAALILIGMLAQGAAAKSFDDVKETDEFAEQIGILSDIGVIRGTDETEFSPDAPVTREQMALLLFRLMLGKDTAGTLNTTAFRDLYDDTYSGAISWANASGYLIGTSADTFEPTAGITLQDAMTMLVRALGHSSLQMNSGYPWTYIDAATKLGLDRGLEKLSYTKELTRAEVAGILYNALTSEYLIPRTSSVGLTFYESTTIIEKVFGYTIADGVLVADNHYALPGADPVTKNGYVTVKTPAGLLTVAYDDLGLDGTADSHLGETLRIVSRNDEKTKLVTVLGCTPLSKTESASSIKVADKNAHVEIGGVKYQVVETRSDALSTNANELLVYVYDTDGELTQVRTNAELSALLGAYDAKLIFDDRNSDAADRLILRSYAFGKLQIVGGKVNLADNAKLADLTLVNPDDAKHGDYVLSYYNEANKTLELAAVLPVSEPELISRLTSTTATIGGVKYDLGSAKLGVSAASIRAQLAVGEKVRIITYGGTILAVSASASTVSAPSEYLIAESGTTPVFLNSRFGYVMEANLDGAKETIFVTNPSVSEGAVYRYRKDTNDVYTLIPCTVTGGVIASGPDAFVQNSDRNNELALVIDKASGTTVTRTDSNYTLRRGSASAVTSTGLNESEISFVIDDDSTIIVRHGGSVTVVKGGFTSDLHVNSGASVTAVFRNEVGSVETLRYLYISDGSVGSVDSTASSVKVLASTGAELLDGKVTYTYSVLDLASGRIVTMNSASASLTVGQNYLTDMNGFISVQNAEVTSGVVTGYTGTTVTVGGTTYRLGTDAVLVTLNSDRTVSPAALADMYMKNVEVTFENGAVRSLIVTGGVRFTASYASRTVTVKAAVNLLAAESIRVDELELVNSDDTTTPVEVTPSVTTDRSASFLTFGVSFPERLKKGSYRLSFEVNGQPCDVLFTVN